MSGPLDFHREVPFHFSEAPRIFPTLPITAVYIYGFDAKAFNTYFSVYLRIPRNLSIVAVWFSAKIQMRMIADLGKKPSFRPQMNGYNAKLYIIPISGYFIDISYDFDRDFTHPTLQRSGEIAL